MKVSACLVTRGDVDMQPVLDTLGWCDEIIVWDNSQREDLGIFGRYAAIRDASNDVIFTQDDDLLVTCHEQLLAEYEPGRVLCNYPQPWDIPWVARGALFERGLPRKAFARYLERWPYDRTFTHFVADAVFVLLSDCKVVDYGSVDLPWGTAPGRVSTSPDWYDGRRPEVQRRCAQLLEVAV